MGGHPVHLALVAFFQPGFQVAFRSMQIRVGNADLLEAELPAPELDLFFQCLQVHGLKGYNAGK